MRWSFIWKAPARRADVGVGTVLRRRYIKSLHDGDEAVAFAWKGFNEPRSFQIISECHSNLAHSCIDGVLELHELVFAPQRFLDFFPGYQFTGAAGQESQKFSRLVLKLDHPAVLAKLSCLKVQLKGLKADSRVALWWRHVYPYARQVKLRGYYTIVPSKSGPPQNSSDAP